MYWEVWMCFVFGFSRFNKHLIQITKPGKGSGDYEVGFPKPSAPQTLKFICRYGPTNRLGQPSSHNLQPLGNTQANSAGLRLTVVHSDIFLFTSVRSLTAQREMCLYLALLRLIGRSGPREFITFGRTSSGNLSNCVGVSHPNKALAMSDGQDM